MADGSETPIEAIRPGDRVMAFDPHAQDGRGALVPRRVTRTFTNVSDTLIDLHGLKVTPGHVVLSDGGAWLTVARVLRQDRAMVAERPGGPVLVRARTNALVGSPEDVPVNLRFFDKEQGRHRWARVRAGIPSAARELPDGRIQVRTLLNDLADAGLALLPNGYLLDRAGAPIATLEWSVGSPLTWLQEAWVTHLDGQPWMPPWIAELPLDDPSPRMAVNAGLPHPPSTPNRRARRRQAALRRVH